MFDGVGVSWPGGSPENTGLILALIVGAYLLILWFSAVVWTARDIHQRTIEPIAQVVFTLIVLVFNFPGLVVYRVLRPPLTLQEAEEYRLESGALRRELARAHTCLNCHQDIAADFLVCPRCAVQLRTACSICERAVELDWRVCPWCAAQVTPSEQPNQAAGADTPVSGAPSQSPAQVSAGQASPLSGPRRIPTPATPSRNAAPSGSTAPPIQSGPTHGSTS